MNCSRYKPV